MAILRSTGVLIGTSETVGDTIANNATDTGAEVDVLGDNTSAGDMEIYLVFTSTVTAGTIDIKINSIRVTGQVYSKVAFERSFTPINGTQKIPIGRVPAARFMNAEVKNNGTGANATNVALLYTLTKLS